MSLLARLKSFYKRFFLYNPGLRCRIRMRAELPLILNARNLLGEGVEVGVQRATFSEQILTLWQGRLLYVVDPWKEFQPAEYEDAANVSQTEQDRIYEEAAARLERFGDRAKLLRTTSLVAAADFEDGTLDFVYLDARHDYDSVKQDLAAWVPKVRSGGILAGHDYLDGDLGDGMFGVKSAVDEFAALRGLTVYSTSDSQWPSWFVFLPA